MKFPKLADLRLAIARCQCLVVLVLTCHGAGQTQLTWAQSLKGTRDPVAKSTFEVPFRIPTAEGPLDIAKRGSASPALFDFDNDGVRDLLIGEDFDGNLRIYINAGSNKQPVFSDFELFLDGSKDRPIPARGVFRPCVADLDSDGLTDLLSAGSGPNISWFPRRADGSFGSSQFIQNAAGLPIAMERTWGAANCDWNADGAVDLIVGSQGQWNVGGNIFLLLNCGETAEGNPKFEDPKPILSREQPIQIPTVGPMPAVADWDGDGLFDIIVKTYEGGVGWLPNIGKQGEPKFEKYFGILDEKSSKGQSGGISVQDFNSDGKLDLLLGANGGAFQKNLDQADRERLEQLNATGSVTLKRWGRTFRLYRAFKQPEGAKTDSSPAKTDIRNQLTRLNRELRALRIRKEYFTEGEEIHSYIWVYLRK